MTTEETKSKIKNSQKAKLKAEKVIRGRLKREILKELHKNPEFQFIKKENINLKKISFFDIPERIKKDYKELKEQINKTQEKTA